MFKDKETLLMFFKLFGVEKLINSKKIIKWN